MNTQTVSETWRSPSLMSIQELQEEMKRIEIEKSRREIVKSNFHANWHTNVSIH
jgi:hypothetical protein